MGNAISNLIPITRIYDIYPKYTYSEDVKKFMDEIVDIKRADVYTKDEVISVLTNLRTEIEKYQDPTKKDCQFDSALNLCLKIIDKHTREVLKKYEEQEPVYYPPCIDCHKKMDEIRCAYDKLKEQEPCENAISRQEVLDEINRIGIKAFETYNDYSQFFDFVDTLPPVTPQPKMGHWIRVDKDKCKCDQCEVISFIAMYPNGDKNYCPNCGAKMEVTTDADGS